MVAAINEALGNVGTTVTYAADSEANRMAALTTLTRSMASGGVDTLVILGGNPVYDAPADLDFGSAIGAAQEVVYVGTHSNETSASNAVNWVVPGAHYLEAWGDTRARNNQEVGRRLDDKMPFHNPSGDHL